MSQTIEAVMHCQHLMSLEEPDPDRCSDGSVHSCTWSAYVQYGDVDVTLVQRNEQKRQDETQEFCFRGKLEEKEPFLTLVSGGWMWASILYVFQLFSKLLSSEKGQE